LEVKVLAIACRILNVRNHGNLAYLMVLCWRAVDRSFE
jgi:hypothetical protein